MTTSKQSIHVEAPVERVFEFMADPLNYNTLAAQDVAFGDVRVTPQGVGTTYRALTRVAGLDFEFDGQFTEFVRNQRIVDTPSGHLEGTFIYTFEPEGSGTSVTMEHIPGAVGRIPILGRLVEGTMTHNHEEALKTLKALMEA